MKCTELSAVASVRPNQRDVPASERNFSRDGFFSEALTSVSVTLCLLSTSDSRSSSGGRWFPVMTMFKPVPAGLELVQT